jgi:DNA invertase Pin-like site-specific DNA recombinase
MTMTTAPAAICYVRVSTDEQAATGHSLEAQESAVRAYCALRGFVVSAVIVDAGVSGGTPLANRPGGSQVLAELTRRSGPRHVVCVKLDRAFRSAADCLAVTGEWDRRGVSLHLTDLGGQAVDTSSAMGRFMLCVLAGAAELEKNLIGERTAAAMATMRACGLYTGGSAPYGYTLNADGVTLTECPTEQATIAEARRLRGQGLSLRKVAAELAAQGMNTRGGKPFGPNAIADLVTTEQAAA